MNVFFFRNDPLGKSITFATEELLRLSETNPVGLPLAELNIRDVTFVEKSIRYKKLETTLEYFKCVGCLCFEEHVRFSHICIQLKAQQKGTTHSSKKVE